jgi:cytochrome c-type biogenesis protein CcmH
MAIWMLFGAMTALAVMAVLWPLSRHRDVGAEVDADTAFYRDQLAEIARDQDRGLLSAAEAESARIEAGRRLLRVRTAEGSSTALGEPALRRRRAVSALALSVVPIMALTLYGAYGTPQIAGSTGATRPADDIAKLDLAGALARIEAHLAQNPQDGRGWEVVAPVYLRIGRPDDAAKAFAAAIRLLGEDAGRLTGYGEAVVLAQGGVVAEDARRSFERALSFDPGSPRARFYLARAAEQDGKVPQAAEAYRDLLATAPPGAPWIPVVREHLARLDPKPSKDGPGGEDIIGMVEGLDRRLETSGGTPDEWGRLVRSYLVLGSREKAAAALARARAALHDDRASQERWDALARELELAANPTP